MMSQRIRLSVLLCTFMYYASACPPCGKAQCPKSAAECQLGIVPDPCACCPLGRCGLPTGNNCYNQTYSEFSHRKFGFCAPSLYCSVTNPDENEPEYLEGICVCAENQVACGSDNRTYDNICALNEAVTEVKDAKTLTVQHWGPCHMEPVIVTNPTNVATIVGQPVTLDCEVKGFPTPVVTWEFTGYDGSTRLLPGDDPLVLVQVRGGPESQMLTTWVQLVELRPIDAGIYSCIATNEKGTTRSMAHVEISGIL